MSENNKHALKFNGKNNYVELGKAASLGLTDNSFTVEAWVNVEDFAGSSDKPILATDQTDKNQGLHLTIRNQKTYMGFYGNDSSGKTTLAKQIWYHLCWRYNKAAGEQAIFINGVLDHAAKGHVAFQGQGMVNIGRYAGKYYFNGLISDLRIWRHVRGTDEILADMYRRLEGNEPGLAGYWPLSEGAGDDEAPDHIKHVLQGTLNAPVWRSDQAAMPFKSDKILQFDGRRTYVDIADLREDFSSGLTVEAWVYYNGFPKWSRIIDFGNGAGRDNILMANESGTNHLVFDVYKGGGSGGKVIARGALEKGRWQHLAVSMDGAGNVRIYKNGNLLVKGRTAVPNAIKRTLNYIGKSNWSTDAYFNGMISDLRFWNKARSQNDIRANRDRRLQGNEAGLAGYWRLNDGAKNLTRDGLTYSHDGLLKNGPGWVLSNVSVYSPLETIPALQFNGKGDCVIVPHKKQLVMPKTITVEAWVNANRTSGDISKFPVISKHGQASGWELRFGGGKASFMITLNKTYYEVIVANNVENGRWYHLAGSYDGNTLRLYMNGILKAQKQAGAMDITQYLGNMNIGRNDRWKDRLYSGKIAEVRVWNKARSTVEIQQNMLNRLMGDEAGLMGYWRLNDNSGARAIDYSQSENHAALSGADWIQAPLPLVIRAFSEADLDTQIRELKVKNIDLRDQLKKHEDLLKSSEVAVQNKEQNITALEAEKKALLDEKEQAIANKDKEIATIQAAHKTELETMAEAGGAETSLSDLIEKTNDEINAARQKLQEQGSSHRLGKVTMEFKMLPGPGGVGMSFPKRDELEKMDATQLSSLNLDFSPRQSTESAVKKAIVPALTGYTEIMAKRKLTELGLSIEINNQATKEASETGRIINQYPDAQTELASGKTVMVFIGKAS
ncbi:MAG: PASTA domain-containing protein [Gammaproteobacteria bacterium]|nr:PASTA domain-containing protein [Gammaproteobacteria bacterium]